MTTVPVQTHRVFLGKLHLSTRQRPPVLTATPNPRGKQRFCSAREDKEGNDTINSSAGEEELRLFKEPKSIPGSSTAAGLCHICGQNPCSDKQHPPAPQHPSAPQHPPAPLHPTLCRVPPVQVTQFIVLFIPLFQFPVPKSFSILKPNQSPGGVFWGFFLFVFLITHN